MKAFAFLRCLHIFICSKFQRLAQRVHTLQGLKRCDRFEANSDSDPKMLCPTQRVGNTWCCVKIGKHLMKHYESMKHIKQWKLSRRWELRGRVVFFQLEFPVCIPAGKHWTRCLVAWCCLNLLRSLECKLRKIRCIVSCQEKAPPGLVPAGRPPRGQARASTQASQMLEVLEVLSKKNIKHETPRNCFKLCDSGQGRIEFLQFSLLKHLTFARSWHVWCTKFSTFASDVWSLEAFSPTVWNQSAPTADVSNICQTLSNIKACTNLDCIVCKVKFAMGCGGSKSAEGHLVWQIAEIPTNPNQLGCVNFFQVFAVFWLKLMFDWPFWQVHWPDPASAPSSAPKAEKNAESMSTAAATSGTAEGLSWRWSLLHSFVISDLGLQNDWSKAEKDRKLNDCRWLRMQCWSFSKFGICSLHIIASNCVLRGVVVPSVFLQFYHVFALQQAFSQMILRPWAVWNLKLGNVMSTPWRKSRWELVSGLEASPLQCLVAWATRSRSHRLQPENRIRLYKYIHITLKSINK